MNAEKFKELRLKHNLKQEDIAKALGISRVAVAKWEAGITEPRCEYLPQISKMLKCKLDVLFSTS